MDELKKMLREEITEIHEIRLLIRSETQRASMEITRELNEKLNLLESKIREMSDGLETIILKTSRIAAIELQDTRKRESKEALKESLKEWLESKYIEFGKYSLGAMLALVLGAITYFVLTMNGWKK